MPEVYKFGPDIDYSMLSDNNSIKMYYERLKEDGWLDNFDYINVSGLPFYINKEWKKIGINLSGGADSAILLYIMAKIINDLNLDIELYPICVSRYWRKAKHVDQAKINVYNYVTRKFKNVIIKDIQWGFIPEAYDLTPLENLKFPDSENLRYKHKFGIANSDVYFFQEFNEWLFSIKNIDIIFSGTTINPENESFEDKPSFRDKDKISELRIFWPSKSKRIEENKKHTATFDPFMFVDKSWTTAQYKNLNVEDLFTMTKSCEQGENGCGKCFHCKERQWSIENQHTYIYRKNQCQKKFGIYHLVTRLMKNLI